MTVTIDKMLFEGKKGALVLQGLIEDAFASVNRFYDLETGSSYNFVPKEECACVWSASQAMWVFQ